MIRPGIAPSLIHAGSFVRDSSASGNQGPTTSLPGRALVHFDGVQGGSSASVPLVRPGLSGVGVEEAEQIELARAELQVMLVDQNSVSAMVHAFSVWAAPCRQLARRGLMPKSASLPLGP